MKGTDEVVYDVVWGHGANYAVIEDAWIDPRPVRLNGHVVKPGDRFTKLGNRRQAACFRMQDGHFLQYEGWAWNDQVILFSLDGAAESTEESAPRKWYYAFDYISDRILLVCNGVGGHTIEWK